MVDPSYIVYGEDFDGVCGPLSPSSQVSLPRIQALLVDTQLHGLTSLLHHLALPTPFEWSIRCHGYDPELLILFPMKGETASRGDRSRLGIETRPEGIEICQPTDHLRVRLVNLKWSRPPRTAEVFFRVLTASIPASYKGTEIEMLYLDACEGIPGTEEEYTIGLWNVLSIFSKIRTLDVSRGGSSRDGHQSLIDALMIPEAGTANQFICPHLVKLVLSDGYLDPEPNSLVEFCRRRDMANLRFKELEIFYCNGMSRKVIQSTATFGRSSSVEGPQRGGRT